MLVWSGSRMRRSFGLRRDTPPARSSARQAFHLSTSPTSSVTSDAHGVAVLPPRHRTVDYRSGGTDGARPAHAQSARRIAVRARWLPEWLPTHRRLPQRWNRWSASCARTKRSPYSSSREMATRMATKPYPVRSDLAATSLGTGPSRVELMGLEPTTPCMPCKCSSN
jgi:hypothetical protein